MSIEPELWAKPAVSWQIKESSVNGGYHYSREFENGPQASGMWEYAKARVQRGATSSCTLECFDENYAVVGHRHFGG